MNKFKMGDWVKVSDGFDGNNLTKGKRYMVEDVRNGSISVYNENDDWCSHNECCFEPCGDPYWLTKKEYEEEINKLKSRYENTPLEYREPKLYRLICPLTERELYINQLKEYDWELVGYNFTQEEINDFWNQDFISKLIKKEYKKEN